MREKTSCAEPGDVGKALPEGLGKCPVLSEGTGAGGSKSPPGLAAPAGDKKREREPQEPPPPALPAATGASRARYGPVGAGSRWRGSEGGGSARPGSLRPGCSLGFCGLAAGCRARVSSSLPFSFLPPKLNLGLSEGWEVGEKSSPN